MSNLPPLFAKSRRNGVEVRLQDHLADTERAARLIFRLDKRWGRNWCRFFKIYKKADQEKFLLNLRVAALFHDIGKANEDFQNAVSLNGFYQQSIRHEHLSALILHLPETRQWLSENPDLDLEVITAAVLSHHLKASDNPQSDYLWMQPKGKLSLLLFDNHDEVNAILDQIRDVAGLNINLRLDKKLWCEKSPWPEAQADGFDIAIKFRRSVKPKKDELRLNLLLAVKAGLISADAVASGLVREGHAIEDWINEKVHAPAIDKGEIASAIINQRANAILASAKNAEKRLRVEGIVSQGIDLENALNEVLWSDFQKSSAGLGKIALLLAACGAGKTIAAWKWAEAQSIEQEIGKVIFLYPTRGTATEGFRDYVGFAPEAEASLLHGSAKYELDGIAHNPNDATRDKDYETEARLFALGFWGKRYFSATVDQFLSFLEHSYSSICLLPVLADSAVIIDEVHSFDKRMFESLVCFLKRFDIPVLCMTATLPISRKENLENIGLRVYPNQQEQAELKDLEKAEKHPRYNLEIVSSEAEAMKIAIDEFDAGKRVLWVVNTVRRCQQVAKCFERRKKIRPLVYHSRFRLKDRQSRHKETVEAFQQTQDAKIAITTQVCEMSLDLDADVLITEVAPITSLVQRFGRSNRLLAKGDDFRARLVAYMPEKDKPYNQKDDLEPALAFLRDLPKQNISQRCLAEKLEEHVKRERQHEGDFAPFLSSGYFAVPGNFREIADFTNPCVLWSDDAKKDDLEHIQKILDAKEPIDGFVISVPKNFIMRNFPKPSWLPKYLGVADARFYDEDFGFVIDAERENE